MKSRLVWLSINVAVSSFPSTVNLIFIRFARAGSRSAADPGAALALAPQAAEIKAIARATKAMRFIVGYLLSVGGPFPTLYLTWGKVVCSRCSNCSKRPRTLNALTAAAAP
jgi:hypothetical protein